MNDLTRQHLLPGIELEPVASCVLGRESTSGEAPHLSACFLGDDDGMIPMFVVGHWALDRERPVVSVYDDQVERRAVGSSRHGTISLLHAPQPSRIRSPTVACRRSLMPVRTWVRST